MKERWYAAIDLKSFYASVECTQRGLDPLRTNLVVADTERTEKTICLAVSPSLKALGIPGRARLFEVVQRVARENAARAHRAGGELKGSSVDALDLEKDPSLAVDYIAAPPRMRLYMDCSARIYQIYLRYIAAEDIHVYSIDEVLMDVTDYLGTYGCDAKTLAKRMVRDIFEATGITATAGIGTNLYLAKVAMDIGAKHVEPDEDGVRICVLTERSYREKLWDHRPLTDFWRVGKASAKKLGAYGISTMGDIARTALDNPDLLYRLFGVNAELLIDHSFGYEPCTMAAIKNYRPASESMNQGQVLTCPYAFEDARTVVREMADVLAGDLVRKGLETGHVGLYVGYDGESTETALSLGIPTQTDWYGKEVPKPARGSARLPDFTDAPSVLIGAFSDLFGRIVDRRLLVRRMYVSCTTRPKEESAFEQLTLPLEEGDAGKREEEKLRRKKEEQATKAVLELQRKFGKNAVVRGVDLTKGATLLQRNDQIGGHRA